MLHALADSGECTILATIASNRHPSVAAALSVLNTYFGRPDIPIGVVRGKAVSIGAGQRWDSVIVSRYAHGVKNNDAAWDAVRLYRKILALQPDSSVTIVTVGFLTNMANLLQSGPDEYSALNGVELVGRKVRRLVSMAGRFDGKGGDIGEATGGKEATRAVEAPRKAGGTTGTGEASGNASEAVHRVSDFKEFNVKMDATASKYTFDHWPTPITFSGFEIGVRIFTGLGIVHDAAIQHSPVKDVFQRCIPMDPHDKAGRMSWDETAVLVAVRGTRNYFDVVKGTVICYADGRTGWDVTDVGAGRGKAAGTSGADAGGGRGMVGGTAGAGADAGGGRRMAGGTEAGEGRGMAAGQDLYLVEKMPPAQLAAVIEGLMMHQPVRGGSK